MPDKTHLQLFADQLATWAGQIIENGRTPFRRVDLFPTLYTAVGKISPPLVFWINRQSMIAGGLVFLPDNSDNADFEAEAAAATALGLRHFVTWETENINLWEVTPQKNILQTSLPLSTTDDPAVFHHRLFELIDQFKLLSVTGRIAYEEISPFYLLNLLLESLSLSLPPLLDHCRSERSKNDSVSTAEERATDWNRLIILRLLCLQHWQLMPSNLPLEKLSSTMANHLGELPAPLGSLLSNLKPDAEVELPDDSAVVFHHLLLRLQQIGWQGQTRSSEAVLRLLLTHWYQEGPSGHRNQHRLLFHSAVLAPECQTEISHKGTQLTANALWRIFNNRAHPAQIQGDAFKFDRPLQAQNVHANLNSMLRPEYRLRRQLAGQLRTSWPNRHLTIPGNLPFWIIEATHLLGLIEQEGRIELHIPSNWLSHGEGSFFNELLFSNFVIERIDESDPSQHLLSLVRHQGECLTEICRADGKIRHCELGQNPALAGYRLFYALSLPQELFQLFTEQQLIFLTESANEVAHPDALAAFANSTLGQQLWQLRTQEPPPTRTGDLLEKGQRIGWLIPEVHHLKEFEQRIKQPGTKDLAQELDQILSQLLGISLDIALGVPEATGDGHTPHKPVDRDLGERILQQLEIEGIPRFPQTYLYRQSTGPLTSYSFTPPLTLKQELLGQYEIEDAAGQQLHITGEETKEALLLASSLGLSSLEIPQDRLQTAQMLDLYRQDLQNLEKRISQLCHRQVEQVSAAQRLHKKLWQQLPLPPLKWLSG